MASSMEGDILTLSDTLNTSSPIEALTLLLEMTETASRESSLQLQQHILNQTTFETNYQSHDSMAKLARASKASKQMQQGLQDLVEGGKQASKDVLELEHKAQHVEDSMRDVTHCLDLRKFVRAAVDAFGRYQEEEKRSNEDEQNMYTEEENRVITAAAYAVRDYREVYQAASEKARMMASAGGGDCHERFEGVEKPLVKTVLLKYENAVTAGDLEALSALTPLLGILNLADQGVAMYLRYSKTSILQAIDGDEEQKMDNEEPIRQMANIYNTGVTYLRHHLPMVAHALGGADGDVGLVQLVHIEVEKKCVTILKEFMTKHNLSELSDQLEEVISMMEAKIISDDIFIDEENDVNGETYVDDCGFSEVVGQMSALNSLLDEIAVFLQYTESYERFIRHAAGEVSRARSYRLAIKHAIKEEEIEILDRFTTLNETVAELGGYYSGLERALMLASLQKAFQSGLTSDDKYYTEVATSEESGSLTGQVLQTALVEETFYAAQTSTRRVFATGQVGLACAAVNFTADALGRLLREVLSRRAELCADALKPGHGLLSGQEGLGRSAIAAFNNAQKGIAGITSKSNAAKESEDPEEIRRQVENAIARACAAYNDMLIAAQYVNQLKSQFLNEIEDSFPDDELRDQLRTCISSLDTISKDLDSTIKRSITHLSNQILPRVRTIVNEVVGQESTTSSSVGVMSATTATKVKMNYDLDEDGYELSQAGDGYLQRMLIVFDELMDPLRVHLSSKIFDDLFISLIGGASKRLEAAIRRCRFTALGALSLDADVRQFLSYTKSRLLSTKYSSTPSLYAACPPLARLSQLSMLMTVTDLDDVSDMMRRSKGSWSLSAEDSKAFLTLRVDFEAKKVNELLRIADN